MKLAATFMSTSFWDTQYFVTDITDVSQIAIHLFILDIRERSRDGCVISLKKSLRPITATITAVTKTNKPERRLPVYQSGRWRGSLCDLAITRDWGLVYKK